jgi:hypothetical protein
MILKYSDGNENSLVEEKAKNLFDMYEKDGIESVGDELIDDLLEWTKALNFKKYVKKNLNLF